MMLQPIFNSAYVGLADPGQFSNGYLAMAFIKKGVNVFILLLRELEVSSVPSLPHLVARIIPMRSYEQMLQSYTRRIVASVTNYTPDRNDNSDNAEHDVCRSTVMPVNLQNSVAILIPTPSPYRAFTDLGGLFCDPLRKWFDWACVSPSILAKLVVRVTTGHLGMNNASRVVCQEISP